MPILASPISISFIARQHRASSIRCLTCWLLARRRGIVSIVDSMSAFGAMEIDARIHPFDILIASGNKCLEAPPGIAFAIIRRNLLTRNEQRRAPTRSICSISG